MPRRQHPFLYLVSTPGENRGPARWAVRLIRLFSKETARPAIPEYLLADVLADNGLRALETERRRPKIGGPWS